MPFCYDRSQHSMQDFPGANKGVERTRCLLRGAKKGDWYGGYMMHLNMYTECNARATSNKEQSGTFNDAHNINENTALSTLITTGIHLVCDLSLANFMYDPTGNALIFGGNENKINDEIRKKSNRKNKNALITTSIQ